MPEKKQIDEMRIAEWKKKYGDVFKYTVDGKTCYLRKPDRTILAYVRVASNDNDVRFNELLLENCWLDGDEEIKTDDAYFLGISNFLPQIIEIKLGDLSKL